MFAALRAKGLKVEEIFEDVAELTTFPDYRVPQLLRELGVIEYDQELAEKIDAKVELAGGSTEEVEIRAATVEAVERILREMKRLGHSGLTLAIEVDWVLW